MIDSPDSLEKRVADLEQRVGLASDWAGRVFTFSWIAVALYLCYRAISYIWG